MMIEWMSSRPAIALIVKRRKMKLKSAALFTFAKLPLLNPPGAVKKKFCFAIILLTLGKLFPSPPPPPHTLPFHRLLIAPWLISDRSIDRLGLIIFAIALLQFIVIPILTPTPEQFSFDYRFVVRLACGQVPFLLASHHTKESCLPTALHIFADCIRA